MIKSKTAAEKKYLARVAALGCAICRRTGEGETPAQVHHQRTGIGKGMRASHFHTVPLCSFHHTGQYGIHGMGLRAFERAYGVTEYQLVLETQQELGYQP